MISMFLRLVLSAPLSLRGASCALQVTLHRLTVCDSTTPGASTGRLWILRLGLYELTRPKQRADDWIWLIDHTIQLDSVQCLIVVGVRLQDWLQDRRPLEHHDLHFLLLQPSRESTGEVVRDELLRVAKMTGTPRAILSDGGPNLKKGIRLFRETHPRVSHCGDIKHKAALCLKKILTKDDRWQEFLKQCGSSRKHCAKTDMAFLSPPAVRDQARYMNLEKILKWARDMLSFFRDPTRNDGSQVEPWKVTIEFKWIQEFAESIDSWNRLLDIAEQVVGYVRWEGYHQSAAKQLEQRLAHLRGNTLGDQLLQDLLTFVEEQSQAARSGERLVGSTECLESLIGKGKQLEGQQSRSGFTKMILGMAASVVKPTYDTIQAALQMVKTKDLRTWALENLGLTLQAKRRAALPPSANGTKTG